MVEPTIRHLAWWLFTGDDPQAAVTERRLVAEATTFLHGRGFESADEARSAAGEFVEFCRDRMWVFTDVGTDENGEKLYAFTHRTFLEYFAAVYLAFVSDTPEDLARVLAPEVAAEQWSAVSHLAIQVKDRNSDRGADRIFAVLLDPRISEDPESNEMACVKRANMLKFLVACLESVAPSPATVRSLARAVLDHSFGFGLGGRDLFLLRDLLEQTTRCAEAVSEEISKRIAEMVQSNDGIRRSEGLQLAFAVPRLGTLPPFWSRWSTDQVRRYAVQVTEESRYGDGMRTAALHCGVITISQALMMYGGLGTLMKPTSVYPGILNVPYPVFRCQRLFSGEDCGSEFSVIGRYLINDARLPWGYLAPPRASGVFNFFPGSGGLPPIDEITCLGLAAVICLAVESGILSDSAPPATGLGAVLHRYLMRRSNRHSEELPNLPVPGQFRQVFQDWAARRLNFIGRR